MRMITRERSSFSLYEGPICSTADGCSHESCENIEYDIRFLLDYIYFEDIAEIV
jgi:hypothetical protein